MEVTRETIWKRCLFTPTKPPRKKNSNICLLETAYQHKGTRKKSVRKQLNCQAAIIQRQRQCLKYKPHRKPWPKSKTGDISKQSPSPLHHTFFAWTRSFHRPIFIRPGENWTRTDCYPASHRSIRLERKPKPANEPLTGSISRKWWN